MTANHTEQAVDRLRLCVRTGRWSGMGAEDNEPERLAYDAALDSLVTALTEAEQRTAELRHGDEALRIALRQTEERLMAAEQRAQQAEAQRDECEHQFQAKVRDLIAAVARADTLTQALREIAAHETGIYANVKLIARAALSSTPTGDGDA